MNETERRLNRLVDQGAYLKDAYYHAQVALLRSWLHGVEDAMEDEKIPSGTIQRVLNRLVYACPSGADAYERMERHDEDFRRMMQTISVHTPRLDHTGRQDCSCGASGVDQAHFMVYR